MGIAARRAPSGEEDARRAEAAALAAGASVEARPQDVMRLAQVAPDLTVGTTVFVPFLPGGSFAGILEAVRRLSAAGMGPVPHVPARRVGSAGELAYVLGAAADGGARSVLFVAGDLKTPAGPFPDTLAVLESGIVERSGIASVGFAGHPEGLAAAGPGALDRALSDKRAWAERTGTEIFLVTQFAFEAGPVLDWLAGLEAAGHRLPVRVGIPGPASVRTLLSFALACGVGSSARALAGRPGMARLAGRWTPDAMVEEIAAYRAERPEGPVAGIRLFPFGGLARTLDWLRERAASPPPSASA